MTATVASLVGLAMISSCSFIQTRFPANAAPSSVLSTWAAKESGSAGSMPKLPSGSIGSDGPVVGVNLYAPDNNYTASDVFTDGNRMLSYIKNVLHASAVDIVWNLYSPGSHSNEILAGPATLPASDVGILTQLAEQEHLIVEYRPLVFVLNGSNPWEGIIKPSDPSTWFHGYYAMNLPYLRVAQEYHVSEYVLGTELDGVSTDGQWTEFQANCAKVYHGQISYAAHEVNYFPPGTQLPLTELTGVDMYEPLYLPASAPLSAVVAAYEQYFAKVPPSLLDRTAIQETGIQARAGAYIHASNLMLPGELDEAVQSNWFIAACETVKRFHMRAVFYWKVDLSDYPLTHPASSLSTFEGKEGATAIGECEDIIRG